MYNVIFTINIMIYYYKGTSKNYVHKKSFTILKYYVRIVIWNWKESIKRN
jgi:hypothetical protein